MFTVLLCVGSNQLQAKNEMLLRGGAAAATVGVITLVANLLAKDAAKDAIRAADKTPDIADDLVARGAYWYTHLVKVSALTNIVAGAGLMVLGNS